ncbi:TonB-dependent receptor [Novosphingobium sp. RL4]|uniref:TonB-dependent receptor n=1 Tax=Novosphingobium sp. RL4 TaxID=3109595 RepID=UPI002D78B89C|nr:TonB-dependent receptor [Novosphingobium sp. RL4]WRT93982.1 TonB-dependent receptor [Novosphingobium sp. RL4]
MPLPALAREASVTTRAGTASEAAIDLARQTGTSIVIADPAIARRSIPALRGRMEVSEALNRLARSAGARAVPVGPSAWRLEAAPPAVAITRTRRDATRPAQAAPPAEPHGEPIVVQATKRDLRIEDVPGQLAILDGKALEAGGVGGTEKITRQLATVSSTHLGSGRNKLFIRGIADSSFTGPTQATVGQYLGDMRLTYNAPDPDLRLSDLARVEVLEGPQGTLYGAGSLGGIIRLVPNAPVMGETGGSVMIGGSLTQHGAPGADASATVNLPLAGESVALRATIDSASLGGYIDKPELGRSNVNRTDILGGKLALRAHLAPGWTIDLIGLSQSTEADDSQYADRDGKPLESSARVAERANAHYTLGQFVVSGRIGDVNLRSTTGIVSQDLHERYDASEPGGPPRLFSQVNETQMIVHETRIWQRERRGFGWLLGASYTHNRTTLNRSFQTPLLDARTAATGVGNTIDEVTLYGEASLHLMGPLAATAGGRFTRSRLSGDGEDISPAKAMALIANGVTAQRSLNTFLPSFALNARFSPEDSFYLRYQEGFRPGGFAIESDTVRRFQSDRTGTFEIGARHGRAGSSPFDLSMSLSYTRWRDIQADFIDNSGLPSTANIGDGRVWSVSLSGGLLLAPGLRVELGATWNESKVDEPSPGLLQYVALSAAQAASYTQADLARAVAMRAMQVPNIARFAGHSGIAWTHEFADGDWGLTANGWANYLGRSRLGIGPELGEPQGNYLDSGFDIRFGTSSYGVTLSVTNLADVRGNRFSLGTPFSIGRDQVTPLRPRTARIGLDARF